MSEEKPRIGQFTLTRITNGWLVRYDVFEPKIQVTIPNIEHCDSLQDCFEVIKGMDPDRPESKIKVVKDMPTVPKREQKAH